MPTSLRPSPTQPTVLLPDEADALDAVLDSGEALTGVVRTRARPSVGTWGLYGVAALLAVLLGVLNVNGAGLGWLPTLLVALAAIAAVVGVDRRHRRPVAYAVTDRRLIEIERSSQGVEAHALPDKTLGRRRLDVRAGGTGRVRLVGDPTRSRRLASVRDVRAFNALLDALPGAAPSLDGTREPGLPPSAASGASALRDSDVARIARHLDPDERILWLGQPEATWAAKQTMNGAQQRAIVAILPMVGALGLAAALGVAAPALADAAGPFVVLFQLLGVAPVLWLASQMRRRTVYVVTDRRALVGMPTAFGYDVRSYTGADLARATVRPSPVAARRNVHFGDEGGEARVPGYRGGRIRPIELSGPTGPGFEFVRDADAVCALLHRVAAASTGEAPSEVASAPGGSDSAAVTPARPSPRAPHTDPGAAQPAPARQAMPEIPTSPTVVAPGIVPAAPARLRP